MKKDRRRISPFWSLGILIFATLAYAYPTNALYAFTIWPSWLSLLIGLVLALGAHKLQSLLVLVWLVFGFLFVEEFRSIPRGLVPESERNLRVISLNCAGGEPRAAGEVAAYLPDVVLLQETPSRMDVEKLTHELFGEDGSCLAGPDATIIARGRLVPLPLPRGTSDFVAADLTVPSRQKLRIVSLRLLPPLLRFDLWNPDAWRSYAENRKARRDELHGISRSLDRFGRWPDLLGGDFNTPPDRGITKPLAAHLRDSFHETGTSYGPTAVNPWALVRIDQIWHGPGLRAIRTTAHNTVNSDHRLVVADFQWAR